MSALLPRQVGVVPLYNLGGVEANGSRGVSIIGVGGGSSANGASVVLWSPQNHPDQFWF